MITKKIFFPAVLWLLSAAAGIQGQNRYELNEGWKCLPSTGTKDSGEKISLPSYPLLQWKNAAVPGTVLTTQLLNGEIPDPFYGMNNNRIPDIYDTGNAYYTYWFVKDFRETAPAKDEKVWLTFRGINYRCEIYLNGQKVNREVYEGMFLRKTFNITGLLSPDGNNRLAVIVYPVDPVGMPNGGQGGDGRIAKNVSHQYVAGWDWIQPIRDRNTGIWDKVFIEKTGLVNLQHPHVVTLVPGKRMPDGKQDPATVKLSVELDNAGSRNVSGTLSYQLEGVTVSKRVTLEARTCTEVAFPDHLLKNPRLWWPSGYGEQNLYNISIKFQEEGTRTVSDVESLTFGVREIQTEWNPHTRSKEISVNGQRLFIKGGNWILSDALLRLSKERYDAEVRYHRDMNLNLIRIWGGALTERPEFYEACDKYGLLVIQDFWFSGDCNGRWEDSMKTEDQWIRRNYPDNHSLALESAADMIKMIRNHPSLAIWCGGNEIMPPADILLPLRDKILPALDGTRWFIDYSNSDEWSYNFMGGNGDGPYTIQPVASFWDKQSWPFNSEIGSVGVGDYESLERFLPEENRISPAYAPEEPLREKADSVWTYHTYTGVGYEHHIEPYGTPKDVNDFARKAQLVNYNQYRALMEGFSSHVWDWYTGVIIWKTQNPWTSMRGQMYDCYLDPNACLFGLRKGGEMLHIMCHPVSGMIMIVNNGFSPVDDMMIIATAYDMEGREKKLAQEFDYIGASTVKKYISLKNSLGRLMKEKGGFLYLQLLDANRNLLSDNFYWYPDSTGRYSGLETMKPASLAVSTRQLSADKMEITLSNPHGNPVAFFNRISLINPATGKRILPAFYDDNYVSIVPGASKRIQVEYVPQEGVVPEVRVEGFPSVTRPVSHTP